MTDIYLIIICINYLIVIIYLIINTILIILNIMLILKEIINILFYENMVNINIINYKINIINN